MTEPQFAHNLGAHPPLPGLPYSEHIFYLSGPMTGLPEYNVPEFQRITEMLRSDGYIILSPHETQDYPYSHEDKEYDEEKRWQYYLAEDKKLVEQSTATILMVGWPYSSGARQELSWAIELKHPIFYFYDGHPYTIFPMTLEGHYGTAFQLPRGTQKEQKA